ncbi:MAG: LytTR family DNA-binding domain-containing protein [Ferruginibacter sp.]
MPLKCIAIDDEPLALELIKSYAAQLPQLQLLQTFDDAISGGEFLRATAVDLLFVDINMPDISGIELVKSLENKPIIIFTTAHKKFAYEGFELEALDYLLKPIDFERFKKAVVKAVEFDQYKKAAKEVANESFFVRSEYKMVKIGFDEIDYIESLEDYIRIHIANGRPILTLMTLKSVIEKLPADKFIRIHRSYIIPLNRIRSVVNKKVFLTSSKVLPVSDTYLSAINEWMNR